jgi:hypothetical protein
MGKASAIETLYEKTAQAQEKRVGFALCTEIGSARSQSSLEA